MPRELTAEEKTKRQISRWRRFQLRLLERARWRAYGLLLWVLQRPAIRFLPFPYPSTASVEAWIQQVKDMLRMKIIVTKHGNFVLDRKLCAAKLLQDCRALTNRVGWKLAFLEDPILDGLLAARAAKGQTLRIRQAVLSETKEELQRMDTRNQRDEAARALIGPKGGLPSLKNDLLRLGALLRLEVNEQMTVEQLKKLCKPAVELLKPNNKEPRALPEPPRGARPKASAPGPRDPLPSTTAAPSTPGTAPGLNLQHVQMLFEQQDQRVQGMVAQMMQQMMTMMQNPYANNAASSLVQTSPEQFQMTDEEMAEINGIHGQIDQEERLWGAHGEDLWTMTPQQIADLQDEL